MKKKRIAILGAGISGLSLAWFLKKKLGENVDITILEKSNRAGGWIRSIQKDGFFFELGPHSCRPSGTGQATLQLIEELNLQDQIIFANPAAAKRFLYIDQQLRQLPANPFSLLFSRLTFDFFSALLKDLSKPASLKEDETVYNFASRRFGANIAEKLLDPMATGIYAGDIKSLSVRSCFPSLFNYEKMHGSVFKGILFSKKEKIVPSQFVKQSQKKGLFSFKDGMKTITNALKKQFSQNIRFSSEVRSIKFLSNLIEINLNNESLQFDHLFSTIPSYAIGELLAPVHAKLGHCLQSIEHASLAVINLGYSRNVFPQKGFGYLIPSSEKEKILGVIWDSCVFPQQNNNPNETRLTIMMGGSREREILNLGDEEILNMALEAISRHLKIKQSPEVMSLEKVKNAIPQYNLGHFEKIEYIEKEVKKLSRHFTCFGSSLYGVSINDCIANSEKAASNFSVT